MRNYLILLALTLSLSLTAQTEKDSLVDLYDLNHKLLKMDIHVNDLLDEMEEYKKDGYIIREVQKDGTLVECKYVRRKLDYLFL